MMRGYGMKPGREGRSGKPGELVKRFDPVLFLLVLAVTLAGIAVIYGATYSVPGLSNYGKKQFIWLLVCLPAFFLMCAVDYRRVRQISWPFYFVIVLALLLLPVLGHQVKGAKSWYAVGPHRIQPSEFAKIAVALCLSHYLASRERPIRRIRDVLVPLALGAVPAFLILIQPDLGTASLFLPLVLVMLFAAGSSKRLIFLILLLAVWVCVSAYPFLRPYQKARIRVFLHPEHDARWQGYNILQAEISLGSGGVTGKGWKQGTQTRLRFLPERHTDFIFSSLGEQFGMAGCAILLVLYALISLRIALQARHVRNRFGRLAMIGLLACFLLHVIFNVGMSLRLLPVTGLPLPLFSYGGSFLLTNYLIFGMIQSIIMRRFQY